MAHFAEIDENGIVLRVIVVADSDVAADDGTEVESIGVEFCRNLLGGTWKQTSYNGNIRKNFAGVGHRFDESRDAFIAQQPFPSWVLDEETCSWQSPVPYPEFAKDGESYSWDEENLGWVKDEISVE